MEKTPKKTKEEYEQLVSDRLLREVEFDQLARGHKEVFRGVLLALVPAGSTLQQTTVKAPLEHFEGFKADGKVRDRAMVCVVKTNEPESGKARFFTPRVQQVRW
jgi:hypothetical protein